MATSNEMGHQD